MFNHMVMFRFPDDEVAAAVIERLHELADRLPQVEELIVGRDQLHSERSFDVGMLMRFADRETFEAYEVHPVHVEAATWIDDVATEAVAVDWLD